MKSNKKVIIILTCIIVLLLCTFFFLLFSSKKKSEFSEIICTKQDDKTYKNTIKYDKSGRVISYQYTLITKFDKEKYEEFKTTEKQNSIEYKYDDNKYQVTQIEDEKKPTDEEENEISLWYVTYVKSLEKDGYSCK